MTSSTTPITPCPICNTRKCESSYVHAETLLAGVRTCDVRHSFNPNYRDPIGQ